MCIRDSIKGYNTQGKKTINKKNKTTTSSSGNVFSRLAAPTKATMGKSRRLEDQRNREEWKRDVDMQIEQEDQMVNKGGFVLKEQRYRKSAASGSPLSSKYKKRPGTAVTTSKITRSSYQGPTATTKTVWKGGKKQVITTTTEGSRTIRSGGLSGSKKVSYQYSGTDGSAEYEIIDGKRVKITKTTGSRTIKSNGLTGSKEVTYQYSGGVGGEDQYQIINGKRVKISSSQASRYMKSGGLSGDKEVIYKYSGGIEGAAEGETIYQIINGQRVQVSASEASRLLKSGQLSGSKQIVYEYADEIDDGGQGETVYKIVNGQRVKVSEGEIAELRKSGRLSESKEVYYDYSGATEGIAEAGARYEVINGERVLVSKSTGQRIIKSGGMEESKLNYEYSGAAEDEGEYEIINGKRFKVSESKETRFSRAGEQADQKSYEYIQSKASRKAGSMKVGKSLKGRKEYESTGGNIIEYGVGNNLVRYELEESTYGPPIMWEIGQDGSRKKVKYEIVEEQLDRDEGEISHDILEDRQVQYMDTEGRSMRYEILAGAPSKISKEEVKNF